MSKVYVRLKVCGTKNPKSLRNSNYKFFHGIQYYKIDYEIQSPRRI